MYDCVKYVVKLLLIFDSGSDMMQERKKDWGVLPLSFKAYKMFWKTKGFPEIFKGFSLEQ